MIDTQHRIRFIYSGKTPKEVLEACLAFLKINYEKSQIFQKTLRVFRRYGSNIFAKPMLYIEHRYIQQRVFVPYGVWHLLKVL
jgi:hypothetical protein